MDCSSRILTQQRSDRIDLGQCGGHTATDGETAPHGSCRNPTFIAAANVDAHVGGAAQKDEVGDRLSGELVFVFVRILIFILL